MRRWTWIIVGGAIAALALLAWGLWPAPVPGPVVHGRPLGDWLADRRKQPDGSVALSGEAAEAVRSLGPGAVPALLAFLQQSDPPIRRWPVRLGRFLRFNKSPTATEATRRLAVLGFRALGPGVRPAWPALVAIALRPSDDWQFRDAVDALTGTDVATMRLLADGTKDPDPRVRSRAILAMQILRIAPGEVILPTFEALKTDPDPMIQGHLALAFADILEDLPLSATLLRDPKPERRANGARLVGEFRTRARKYLPDLEALADDPDPAVRAAVAGAIRAVKGPAPQVPPRSTTSAPASEGNDGARATPAERPAHP